MRQHGFSLLELSIVLVIIGLIAGGIVAGASMIRAAEIRSVMTDLERFKAANYTFRDKYFYYPGDLKNATAFWPGATGNGNGDGIISEGGSEFIYSWQHFSLSGMISGNFDGIYATLGDYRIGENVPEAFDGTFYNYISEAGSTIYNVAPSSRNTMRIQSITSGSGTYLSATEAWGIDKKLDDGLPTTGRVIAFGGIDTSTTPNSYALNTDAINTNIWFYLD